MELVQSFFIHRFICFAPKLSCIENTFNTWIIVVTNERTNFAPFYIFVLMFSTHDICAWNVWTYELMNFTQLPLLNHCMPNLWYTFHNHCLFFSSNYVLIMVMLVLSFHLSSSLSTTFASKPPYSIGCFAIDVLPFLSTCNNIGHYYKMWV
jgi:hypothetical protein